MARKGATRRKDPGRRSAESPAMAAARGGATTPETGGIERALLATLALDAALAVTMLYVHARLQATDGAYTSFCNVSAEVNCDTVLGSPYSTLLGIPVAAWSLLAYLLLAGMILWRRRTAPATRPLATLAVVALASFNLAFSLYMAFLAAVAVRALCLLCAGMYLLNAVVAVLAWRLASAQSSARGPALGTRRALVGTAVLAAAVAILGARQLGASAIDGDTLRPADVRERNPKFYDWYTNLPVVAEIPRSGHARGPADAPITIVEFSDFECAYCAKAFQDLREVERQHAGRLRVVFHHFPLDTECNPHVASRLHPDACLAAIAAECAARAGHFWDYHDRLFANQDRLGRDDLIATAVDLGIARGEFIACLADPASRARVIEDAHAGARLGVKSTPTLFINGRTVEGALDRGAYEYVLAMERRS
jgi:protein-disulfide isomerase/uncharacterized membrane protein